MFGIIKLMKKIKELKKEIEKEEAEQEENLKKYLSMGTDELRELPDNTFTEAIHFRIFDKEEKNGLASLSAEERAYFVAVTYGIDLWGVNEEDMGIVLSSEYASLVYDSLKTVGAFEHAELFYRFVSENGLNLSELCGMEEKRINKTIRKCKAFKAVEFLNQYEQLGEMDAITDRYIIVNREYFL